MDPEDRAMTANKLLSTAATLCLCAGCITPSNTRLPTLGFGDPKAERQSYLAHNPLPDTEEPFAGGNPRGFEHQRSEPVRTRERYVNPISLTPEGTPAATPPAAWRYPQSVKE
jgi:hypothetical protein